MPATSSLPWSAEALKGYGLGPLSRKTLVVAAGKGVQFAAWVAALAYLARHMDKPAFGLFQQGWLLVSTLTPILILGLPQGLNYLLPQVDREKGRQIIWQALGLAATVALPVVLALLAFPQLAAFLVGDKAIVALIPFLAFLLLATLPGQLLEPLAILKERQGLLFGLQAVHWTLFAVLAVAIGSQGDLKTLFLALALLALLRTLATLLFVQFHFGLWSLGMDWSILRRLGGMCAFLGLVAVVDALSVQVDKYVVCHWFGVERFAEYALGSIEVPFIPLMLAAVTATLIPELSSRLAQGLEGDAIQLLHRSMARLAQLVFPVFFYLLILGPQWITVVFGARYEAAGRVFLVCLFLIPLRALNTHPLFIAAGMQQYLLKGRMLDFTLSLILSIALAATPLGLLGPAVATVVATTAHKIYQTIILARRFGLPLARLYPWRDLAGPAVWAGGGAALAALLLPLAPQSQAVQLGAGTLGYGLWTAWGLLGALRRGARQ